MKTIGKDGILLRLAKDMYPERDDLSSIEVKTLFNDICHKYIQREGIYDLLSWLEGTDFIVHLQVHVIMEIMKVGYVIIVFMFISVLEAM